MGKEQAEHLESLPSPDSPGRELSGVPTGANAYQLEQETRHLVKQVA